MRNLVVGFTATVKGQAMRVESPVLLTQPIMLEREGAKPGEVGDRLCLPVYFLVIVPLDDLRQGLRWVDSSLCEPINYTMTVTGERAIIVDRSNEAPWDREERIEKFERENRGGTTGSAPGN